MNKKEADRLLTEYYKKFFGFALSKTAHPDRAEELASRITLEVYTTLLSRDDIANVDGYIYRIAEHVFSRFISDEKKTVYTSLDGIDIPDKKDYESEVEQSEEYIRVRREIAYLSKTQREIVVLHYYDRLKLREIAERLGLPEGTVKWHLYEAKNCMKEGMSKMRTPGILGVRPIKMSSLGHSGSPGKMGDTSDFLAKRITQNIAYAAYWEPRTINEIAEELSVSPVFVADEIETLEEYGFLDKLPGERYRTNIYITEETKEVAEAYHILMCRYAGIICEKYIPGLIENIAGYDRSLVYVPDGDANLLLWSAVPGAIGKKFRLADAKDSDACRVKRKDGGDYTAFATVETGFKVSFDESKYSACGDMYRGPGKYTVTSWQLNTYYDGRPGGWRDNLYTDYDYLYEFITGALKSGDLSQVEKYRRLRDKGYLVDGDERDEVNLIVVEKDAGKEHLNSLMPEVSDELKALSAKLDDEIYALKKELYPPHMQKLCRAYSRNEMSHNEMRMRVIEKMLEGGLLALPQKKRKSGLVTLVFSDRLPD